MSIDIFSLIHELAFLVVEVIFVLSVFRAIEMGRAFVNRVYRDRAIWITAVIVVAVISDLTDLPPLTTASFGPLLSTITLVVLIAVAFAFVDSTILVTLETDFFHRNTLRWKQARLIAYPLLYGLIAFVFFEILLLSLPSPPSWVSAFLNSPALSILPDVGLSTLSIIFGYSAVAVIIGSRRTPDRILRRHVKVIGLAFLLFIVSTINDLTFAYAPLDVILSLAGAYVIYRAVMSLSPIRRIEKETA